MELSFYDPDWVHAETIQVIWDNKEKPSITMRLINGLWQVPDENQVEKNQRQRYRYLINNSISINDPYANMYETDENGRMWSIYLTNEAGIRVYNATQYYLNIEDVVVSDSIDDRAIPQKNHVFIPIADEMIAIRVRILSGTGLHVITMLYVNPKNEIVDLAEQTVNLDSKDEENIIVWFYRKINQKRRDFMYGTWNYKILVDGELWLQDKYIIEMMQQFSVQI